MKALLSVIAVVASALAGAQSLPTAPHLTLEQRGAFLLADSEVRMRIFMVKPTWKKLDETFVAYGAKQSKLFAAKSPDPKAIKELDISTSKTILAALIPSSRKALYRIAIEKAGPSALLDKDIAAKLKITPAQRASIIEMLEDASEPLNKMVAISGERMARAKDEKEREELRKQYDGERKRLEITQAKDAAKAFRYLTAKQAAIWKEIQSQK